MRLATWNVNKPTRIERQARLRGYLDIVAADVLVLTEAHDSFDAGYPYRHSSSPGRDDPARDTPLHRWVTIWSAFPLEPLETCDPIRTAAARARPPGNASFVIYGTVLPWRTDQWRGHCSNGGEAFAAALDLQTDDWVGHSESNPGEELFVLGDFNQELVYPLAFGTRTNQKALTNSLARADLSAVTSGDADPVRLQHAQFACVDHVCIPVRSAWQADPPTSWPKTWDRTLTDHFGSAVRLRRRV